MCLSAWLAASGPPLGAVLFTGRESYVDLWGLAETAWKERWCERMSDVCRWWTWQTVKGWSDHCDLVQRMRIELSSTTFLLALAELDDSQEESFRSGCDSQYWTLPSPWWRACWRWRDTGSFQSSGVAYAGGPHCWFCCLFSFTEHFPTIIWLLNGVSLWFLLASHQESTIFEHETTGGAREGREDCQMCHSGTNGSINLDYVGMD